MEELHIISWSGGNDSTVMLHYLINKVFNDDTDFRVYFMDTTITLPAHLEYIETIIDAWDLRDRFDLVKAEKTFFEILDKNHFWPSINTLWCRPILKVNTIKKYYQQLYQGSRKKIFDYVGVSIFDSPKRRDFYSNLKPKDKIRKFGYAYVHERYPILRWTDFKKQAYCKKHNIPTNPCYKLLGVSGCYVCPFYHLPYYKKLRYVYPDIFWNLYEWERKIGSRISPEFSLHSLATMKPLIHFTGSS